MNTASRLIRVLTRLETETSLTQALLCYYCNWGCRGPVSRVELVSAKLGPARQATKFVWGTGVGPNFGPGWSLISGSSPPAATLTVTWLTMGPGYPSLIPFRLRIGMKLERNLYLWDETRIRMSFHEMRWNQDFSPDLLKNGNEKW